MSDLSRVIELDRALARAAVRVRVLTSLGWPPELEARFLEAWRQGSPRLPEAPEVPAPSRARLRELAELRASFDLADPLQSFLDRTAESHLLAGELLAAAGTPRFRELSLELYGGPGTPVHPGAPTTLEAAQHFVERTRPFATPEPEGEVSAAEVAAQLQREVDLAFGPGVLPVTLAEDLSGKATAGSTRVQLRADARFTPHAAAQLLHHEALVHAATKRAGKAQPVLSSLGLSSPRTTEAQEGLATFAEMITDAMDIARLRRIALRPVAVAMALDGADFIEVFTFFVGEGQPPEEAFASTQRVFRGGDVRGGVAFTKDALYLRGLVGVHTFLRKACEAHRHRLPRVLFAGRMTLGDALALEPFFEDGTLVMPEVLPAWVKNEACLAAYLTWSVFTDRIHLGAVSLDDFAEG